jgi:hypothetical protein
MRGGAAHASDHHRNVVLSSPEKLLAFGPGRTGPSMGRPAVSVQ